MPTTSLAGTGQRAGVGHVAWVLAAAVLGFVVPAVGAGWLRLPREAVVLVYLLTVGPFLYGYVSWSPVDVVSEVRRHWAWGVLAGVVAGAFVVMNVFSQPASAAPAGLQLVAALLWLGLVYGALDALFLSVLPIFATWQALTGFGWTGSWPGRIGAGIVALLASVLVTAAYHLGYPEYHGPGPSGPLLGNTVMSLGDLVSTNPLGAVLSHVAMHVAAVLHGMETTAQLPPHYW